jgi:peptide-methionine (S)-S-oxide reductase
MRISKYFVIAFLIFAIQLTSAQTSTEKATFAGGCFWCMEPPFEALDGVISVTSGFTGGDIKTSYKEVSSGQTKHFEAVEIIYDPTKVTYEQLLQIFWKNIDPTDAEGQFCDRGAQYRSAIFVHNEKQKGLAEQSKIAAAQKLNKQIITPIIPASQFYIAEAYHQDFYKKNALRYKQYKIQCGRDRKLRSLWGSDNDAGDKGKK